jgi:hypothetical protein
MEVYCKSFFQILNHLGWRNIVILHGSMESNNICRSYVQMTVKAD